MAREWLAWTGDYQIFAPTATRLFDVLGFSQVAAVGPLIYQRPTAGSRTSPQTAAASSITSMISSP